MWLIVCGGRTYGGIPDPDAPGGFVRSGPLVGAMFAVLDTTHYVRGIQFLIHGGAGRRHPRTRLVICGADLLAGEWAMKQGIPVREERADWKGRGGAAGPERNKRMLDLLLSYMGPKGVLALPGGKGTRNMVDQAVAAGVKVWQPLERRRAR